MPNFAVTGALRLVLLAAIVVAAGFLIWFFLIRPGAAIRDAEEARGGRIIAEAQTEAAKENIEIIVDHRDAVVEIRNRTETLNNEIRNAPGAGQLVDPAGHAAGIRALCLHDGRASDPQCADVLHGNGGGVGTGG